MKKLTILVDMDDTIENLCEVWVKYLNELHYINVSIKNIQEWDITKAFPMLNRSDVFAPLSRAELWERVTPLPGAVEYLKRLIDDGHKVIIVTASDPDIISLKLTHVLFKYFPYFTYNDVIITSQKQFVRGDILVDDAPHNLEGGCYVKLLFDAPHNQLYEIKDDDMFRVHDWQETYAVINYLSRNLR